MHVIYKKFFINKFNLKLNVKIEVEIYIIIKVEARYVIDFIYRI